MRPVHAEASHAGVNRLPIHEFSDASIYRNINDIDTSYRIALH